jgi:RNA polymerase sigma factor for flagellar operon FliA
VQEWGRWRPSAAAKREGPLGVKLETLIYRDGVPLAVAGQMLRTSGETALSDSELANIIATFPRRSQARPAQSDEPLMRIEGPDRADQGVAVEEAAAVESSIMSALNQELAGLPEEDRLIVRLRYMEGMSVADIARALALPQKPLYRRLNDLLAALQVALERAGFSREHLRDLTEDPP